MNMFTHYRITTYRAGSYQWYLAIRAQTRGFGFIPAVRTDILDVLHKNTPNASSSGILYLGRKDVEVSCSNTAEKY